MGWVDYTWLESSHGWTEWRVIKFLRIASVIERKEDGIVTPGQPLEFVINSKKDSFRNQTEGKDSVSY